MATKTKASGGHGTATSQRYSRISADSHIDLVWLPPDLFVSNASPEMKDRMPRVVDSPDGPRWVSKHGTGPGKGRAGFAGGVGSSGKKYVPGMNARADALAAEGIYSEESRLSCRLTDPDQRVKDQDRDGVQCEVIYGILGTLSFLNDDEASWEVCRIYNDWLADFCKAYPDRLIGLPVIPGNDVDAALEEFDRIRDYGFRGIELGTSDSMPGFYERQWDRLWAAVSETGTPVHIHGRGMAWPSAPHWTEKERAAAHAAAVSTQPLTFAPMVAAILLGGALERYPDLRIVLGESGIGWIPFLLDRMDFEWEDGYRDDLDLTMKPSEYWRRQCKATFQYDEVGLHLIEFLGAETLMWASDFPHPQGTWPDSAEFIERQFGHLPEDVTQKIVAGNAVEFYGLP